VEAPALQLNQNRALIVGFALAVLALAVFSWLAAGIWSGQTLQFDSFVRGTVHSWASPPLTRAMRMATFLGSAFVLVPLGALAACWLVRTRRKHAAWLFVLAALGGEVLENLLKLFFRRPRPEPFFGSLRPSTYSFPSGHATLAFCFYGVLAVILAARLRSPARKAALLLSAGLLALAIGVSRIYLGVHYPSDVLGGYAAAAIWLGAVNAGYHWWLTARG
jgi:membrane-associated phospholipid phosphatase